MAYLVDFTVQESTGGATSVNILMPTHAANDILVVFWTQDASTTASMTGWTQIGTTQTANSAVTSAMFWKRAAFLGPETGTLTLGAADAYTIKTFCIRDVDTTTAIDAFSTTNSGATAASQFSSTTVTTTTTDCFVLYCHGMDGIATAIHSDPGVHFIQSSDSTGTTATTSAASGCAWTIQHFSTPQFAPSWKASLSAVRTNFTVAFRNASGGVVPAYIDQFTPADTHVPGHHFSTLNGISFPGALTLNNGGPGGTGLALTFDAAAAVADFGINPYSAALSNTPPAGVLTGTARGFEVTFNPTLNLINRFVLGTAIASTPRQANYDHGSVSEGGTFIIFGNTGTNTNYRTYQVLAKDSTPNTEGRAVFCINPSQNDTVFGENGTFDSSTVTKMLFVTNNPRAATTLYTTDWCSIEKLVVSGGTENAPVNSEGLFNVGSSFRIKTIQSLGSNGLLSYVPLLIGGGYDPINFQIEGGSLQFPRRYSPDDKEINFHALPNTIGISYGGVAGDVIKHTNSVVSSPSVYYWRIDGLATSSAVWDFRGLTIIGANVTLRNVTTFDLMSFNTFDAVDASGCSLTNCTFTEPPFSSNSIAVNGTTSFNSCSFDTTTISTSNYLTSTANPSIFVDCSFTGSSTSGHAIRITTPGTYSFSGNLFTGYGGTPGDNLTPNSGSTSAAIFNDSGGLVTLNIAGEGTIPSVRNGVGATTDISAAANVTLSGLKADSEVRAYLGTNPATATELAGTESSGTSFTFSQSVGGQAGYIQIFHVEYQPVFLEITYGTSDVDIPIQQIFDRQYARGTVFAPG